MSGGRFARRLLLAFGAALLLSGCRENPGWKTYRQGLQALQRAHYGQSIRLLEQSARSDATNLPLAALYNSLGLAYYRIGQPENALNAFGFSARLDPQFAEPVYNAGVVLVESGRNAPAAHYFDKAAQLDASGTRAWEYQSWIFSRQQRLSEARAALNKARARAPRAPRILTALALLELQATNTAAAVAQLQEALSHDAHYAPAIYNLARLNHHWLTNETQAAKLFKDYLRLAPKGERAANAASLLQSIEKGSATSGAPETAAAAPSANSSAALLRLAQQLKQQGRPEAAISNYLQAARSAEREAKSAARDSAVREAGSLCGQSASAHYEVGNYFVERGQLAEALTHLKRATELSNTWSEAHLALARVAIAKTEFDTAVVSLKQADQNQPKQPEALWLLAQLYDLNLSLTNQAIEAYQQFNRRFAGDRRSAEGRARLKALQAARKR